jgi:transposase
VNRRYGLRDNQWKRIKELLPGRVGHIGASAKDNRLFVDAVLYRYRAGMPWRDMPADYGHWKVIHTRFSRWSINGRRSLFECPKNGIGPVLLRNSIIY